MLLHIHIPRDLLLFLSLYRHLLLIGFVCELLSLVEDLGQLVLFLVGEKTEQITPLLIADALQVLKSLLYEKDLINIIEHGVIQLIIFTLLPDILVVV